MQGRIGQVTEQNNEQLVGTNRADALPKSWEPQAVEKDLYEGWVEKGYFTPGCPFGGRALFHRAAAAECDRSAAYGPRFGPHAD